MRTTTPFVLGLLMGCSPAEPPSETPTPSTPSTPSTTSTPSTPSTTSTTEEDVDPYADYFAAQLDALGVPGLSVSMVRDGQVLWSGAYGFADAENALAVNEDTAFMLASVSKTVTGVALMQLYEDGLFELDDDVNDVLSFSVENPAYAGEPVTYRQLLTHTSSIRDNWNVMGNYYADGDSPVALDDFLEDYLDPRGSEYNASLNFYEWRPEEGASYSNIGVALAGYLVEALSGVPFDTHCDTRIFAPLGMDHTGWHLADFDDPDTEVAFPHDTPYAMDRIRHFGYPDYPDGQLRSSATDIGVFLATFANDGISADGVRILEADTVAMMEAIQFPALDGTQGLIWYSTAVSGAPVMGHGGSDIGTSTGMYFEPSSSAGFVALMNGKPDGYGAVDTIHAFLLEEARTFTDD